MVKKQESYFIQRVLPLVGLSEKEHYNWQESCKILGVQRTTLWRLVKAGKITVLDVTHKGSAAKAIAKTEFIRWFAPMDSNDLKELD